MKFWFEDPRCRGSFFNPAATTARRIYEITVDGASAPEMPFFGFCSLCAKPLDWSFHSPDGWSKMDVCAKGHHFIDPIDPYLSSNQLDEQIKLKREPSSDEVKTYAEVYATKRYASCIHADIRAFMQRYLDTLPKTPA